MIIDFRIFEHKLEKNQVQFLFYLEGLADSNTFIFLDTETTGLGGHTKQQLTQISAVATKFNFSTLKFKNISTFDNKIKLSEDIINSRSKEELEKKLIFNHYDDGDYEYIDEKECLNEFFTWLEKHHNPLLVIQNASFDMDMLCGRSGIKLKYPVLDTKQILQMFIIPIIQKMSETEVEFREILTKIGTSERDHGLTSSSMSKWGPFFDINMSGYHDALTDCYITIEMFLSIVKYIQKYKHINISKYQVERIRVR